MCTGSPPLCSESPWPACRSLALGHSRKWNHALVAQMEERLPCKQRVARSNRRLGHQTCRVRLAGRGLLSFKEATRVRIPYTMPNQKSCVLTRGTETGLKDRGAPELVTGLDMDRCPSGSRGSPAKGEPASPARAFESLTIRQDIGGVAQSAEHLPCKQAVAGSMPVASTRRWFVSSVEERLPVEERAAGSIPARTASTCRNSSEVERCVESAGVGVSKTACGTSKLRPASSAEESTGLRSRGSHVQIVRGAPGGDGREVEGSRLQICREHTARVRISLASPFHSAVAQQAVHRPVKARVRGSSPRCGASFEASRSSAGRALA